MITLENKTIFNDTIYNNIKYGDLEASKEKVVEAANLAGVSEFVNNLPNKMDTIVGESGVKLSGGQRQRIAIARALLRKPSVLVLDDATSAVDPKVEAKILQNIKTETSCSLLVVAHRLATIRLAERVIFLDDGKVVDSGSHEELLQIEDYANLVSAYEEVTL